MLYVQICLLSTKTLDLTLDFDRLKKKITLAYLFNQGGGWVTFDVSNTDVSWPDFFFGPRAFDPVTLNFNLIFKHRRDPG